MRKFLRRLIRDDGGLAAVEFAFVGPPFLLTLLSIIELGLILVTQSLLDGATRDAARSIRTGQVYSANNSFAVFQNVICNDMSMILTAIDCQSNVIVNVVKSGDGTFGSLSFGLCNTNPQCNFVPGVGGDAIGVQTTYARSFIIPWVGSFLSVADKNGHSTQSVTLQSTVVFRNEPFTINNTN